MATYRVPVLQDFSWQPPVEDKDLTSPPSSPTKGDRYIVGPSATGDWAGHDNDIAWYDGTTWQFDTPVEGWQCWVKDEDKFYYYDANSSSWITYPVDEINSISGELDDVSTKASVVSTQLSSISTELDDVSSEVDALSAQADTFQQKGVYVPEYGAIEFTL